MSAFAGDQASVRVEPPNLQGPRPLQEQTAKAAIRDYLDSWTSLSNALQQNRPNCLIRDFIGAAKDKLANTIKEQMQLVSMLFTAIDRTTCRFFFTHLRGCPSS